MNFEGKIYWKYFFYELWFSHNQKKNSYYKKAKCTQMSRQIWSEAVTIMTISKLIVECYYQKRNSLKFFFLHSINESWNSTDGIFSCWRGEKMCSD